LTALASGAVNTGVTKYTAEYFDDEARQTAIWKTAGTIAFLGSLGAGFVIVLLHRWLAGMILKDESFATVFIWLGSGLVLFTLNGLLLAILNGKKEIGRFVIINIAGSLVGLIVTGGLAYWWGLYGALVALAINQSIVFIVTLSLCWRAPWFNLRILAGKLDPVAVRSLGKFTLMALASSTFLPVSQMLIRNHLAGTFGWAAAGHWDALLRISNLYLMLISTPLAVYYLPRLSEIRDNSEMKREILSGYRILLPVAAGGAAVIYLLRDWIIITLFDAQFSPMRDLFAWQMAGDIIKTACWLLGYVFLGKTMVRELIFTEFLFAASWVGFVWLLTGWVGQQGAQMGYFFSLLLYWVAMVYLVIKKLR
jgi:PST family polysaccharide transporter